jgi:uncharacterized protein (TIGR00730 family)
MNLIKAYDNSEFLHGDDARSVRILCEYLEPLSRLRQLGIQRAIVAFGSARLRRGQGSGVDYFHEAAELGERLARWTLSEHPAGERYHLVTGGGPGIMEAFHEGSARVDASLNVGIGISLPFEQHGNPYIGDGHGFEFHYFFMRKFWFMNLAKAVVVFPGGFGTLDELFEVLTLTQVGKSSPMPVVLYGTEFWKEVLNIPALTRRGLISPGDEQLFRHVDHVDEAFAALTEPLAGR